jgi:two-component system cell cycle sensor histidine kinase/response regulator CckA
MTRARRLTLLAVDDTPDNLTTLDAIVTDALPDCDLLMASSGPDGLTLAREADPDVILLDIVMPGMDGFEVCRQLKADPILRGIPVVFLTALRTDRESRIRALEAGAEGFLSKPADEQELVAQVRAMAKIKAANVRERHEKERLEALVAERTRALETELVERRHAELARDRLNAQLHDARKLESVGRLAGGVAHDFNNMLAVILGYTESALQHVDKNQPLHADLVEIQHAAKHSADLTRQLLAVARRQPITPRLLDLNDAVSDALRLLERLIGKEVNLSWLPGCGPLTVLMDPSQVEQILTNLCVNARDAIEGTGTIVIETGAVELSEVDCHAFADATPGAYAWLRVCDDGCGMDEATKARIFEPFYTTKPQGEGTGLGLATVYGAVRQNRGVVHVESEPGSGSTFTVLFPRFAGAPARKSHISEAPSGDPGTGLVLVVDDEPSVLRLATRVLKGHGYAVLSTNSPRDAVRMAQEHDGHIDLLLTDVMMPSMNGRDLAKIVAELRPGIKRLFMSGHTAEVIAAHGLLDEGIHFIEKPFEAEHLGAKVREALGAVG